MLIAFATRDGDRVDDELRRAPQLVVYEVWPTGFRLQHRIWFAERQRSGDRLRALAGCDVVYVRAIGPSLAARLAAKRIQAATAPDAPRILDLLQQLRAWLAVRACGLASAR